MENCQSSEQAPKNAQSPSRPVHPIKMAGHHFSRKKPPSGWAKYTANWQDWRPYKALETGEAAVPWCTVVAGQIDVSSGGEGGKTPMRKLKV